MSFPERLRYLRKTAKLSQQTLGEAMNITKVSISGYETGNRKPDTDTLQRLADYFEVSTDYLLGRSSVMEQFATYKSEGKNLSASLDDSRILSTLRKYPAMYEEIKKDPEKSLDQLFRLWRFLQEESRK